jgi:predicted porin
MQKKLIALAVAGLVSGTAFAQASNVTIYGVGDATFDNVRANSATADNAALPGRNRVTFNSSYIGFKGAESVGNGLTVVFQFETGIGENAGGFGNTSAPGNNTGSSYGWANRDTMVAIAGGFGTVALGNLTGPTRLLGSVFDVNAGATGIGANTALLGKLGGGSGAGVFDQRIGNAIAYISPTFGGFYGVVGYLPNENRGYDTTHALNMSAWTAGGVFGNGPILAGLTWTKAKDAGANSSGGGFSYANNSVLALTAAAGFPAGTAAPVQDATNTRAGFKYDFGMATVGILWDQTKATLASSLGNAKQTVWYLPVTVSLGGGKLIAQYGKAGKVTFGGAVGDVADSLGGLDTSAKHFELGYEYNLSKRTMVKVLFSEIRNEKHASYDYLYGVTAPNTTAYGPGVSLGSDPRGYSIGLRHSF